MPHAPGYGDNAAGLVMMPTMHPWSTDSLGIQLAGRSQFANTIGGVAWPAASLALFVPFRLASSVNLDGMFTSNAASVANSVDLGLYLPDGGYVHSLGLQVRSGTNNPQIFSMAPLTLPAGEYYMAISVDGTTGSFGAMAVPVEFLRGWGVCQQDLSGASPPGTLPTTGATFAPLTVAYLPLFGLRRYGMIV